MVSVGDTQRTLWHLTAAWLSGTERQREVVGHIANRLGVNDLAFARYWMAAALYSGLR